MSASWDTKWGSRRVRQDPPTLAEALAAAQGFSGVLDEQVVIAAGLMGVGVSEAEPEIRRLASEALVSNAAPAFLPRDKRSARPVVVERKVSRRLQLPAKQHGPLSPSSRTR